MTRITSMSHISCCTSKSAAIMLVGEVDSDLMAILPLLRVIAVPATWLLGRVLVYPNKRLYLPPGEKHPMNMGLTGSHLVQGEQRYSQAQNT